MNVQLSAELERFVQDIVAHGADESADGVFAEALRLLREHDENGLATERRRFAETFDLYALGVEVMRQNLRRSFPGESEPQINQRLRVWLNTDDFSDHSADYFRVAPERLKQLIGESS